HAPRAELLLEAERDLEGAAVDADVLPDHEHALVAAHLPAEGVGDRLQVRELGHGSGGWPGVEVPLACGRPVVHVGQWWGRYSSSGSAYTPSVSVAGSGSGDSTARRIASESTCLISAPISSASSSVSETLARSQARKRS